MSIKQLTADGYDGYQETIKSLKGQKIIALFTGSKSLSTGKSWCPDCVEAEPVVEKFVKNLKTDEDLVFITCFVGNRDTWKSSDSPFRTDPNLKLTSIPTLLNVNKKALRLTESQLLNEHLLKSIFQDDE
ncbi:unnamed protein product [Caenorhabditis auriculariae]|uniref:Thioredoxin domain-containing protein 17 n=1 Tax=Caenorhabditis auriculariae TaxID=2777116 RepID=A0A8S1HY32_9PELO|nr:unnamed protein product [Caenorhabditis auriculariae]